MKISLSTGGGRLALSVAAGAMLALSVGSAFAISQSGEQKDMRRVGHVDLQGRAAYHPNFIEYQDGRVIAFVGTHTGTAPNPLNGGAVERNGVMIIDVTDPARPVETAHIPVPGGQSQSVRMCLGKDLPGGVSGRVYMMRNVQGGGSAISGYEVWDVTDIRKPVLVSELRGIRNTHKHWWECTTGIAYLPGSRDVPSETGERWRVGQQLMIFDWRNPTQPPEYLRTFGLPGAEPDGSGPMPPTLHGAISTYEHPQSGMRLARGATEDDAVGNRIYLAWGVGDNGVMTVLDRKKLLPPPHGTWSGSKDRPSVDDLLAPQTARLDMSNDHGGHTSFPVFGMKPKSYGCFTEYKTRDIVLLASESTANRCNEAPHWSFVVDVTIENSKNDSAGPPSLRAQQNPWQGPMVLATMHVDPRAGEKYPRGNYCTRGARFGVHSSEENFRNPFYGRLTFLAYFTGGVRAWDIREPHAPVEVAFYVPESNANTTAAGYMTNNLEVDHRGYIYAADRSGAGLDILELHGKALQIGLGKDRSSECINIIPPGGGGGGGG